MLWVLLRYRLLGARNVARFATRRQRWLSAALSLMGFGLAVGVFAGFRVVMLMRGQGPGSVAMTHDLVLFLFLFLLAGSVPFLAATLLHPGDLPLLGVAPVRPRHIVAERLLEGALAGAIQFGPVGAPALVACAAGLGLPTMGWILLAPLAVAIVLLPSLATAILLLASVATLGPKRVRGAIAAVNVLLGSVVCLTAVGQVTSLRLHEGLRGLATAPVEASALAMAPPVSWCAEALLALSHGDWRGFGVLMLALDGIVVALAACALWIGERLTLSGALDGEEGGSSVSRAAGRGRDGRWARLLANPFGAMARKELLYVQRDSLLLSQLGMPAILYFVPFAITLNGGFRARVSSDELFAFAVLMVLTIVYMQASILSASSVGLEGRAFWIYLSSPNRAATALRAKFMTSWVLSAGVSAAMLGLAGLAFGADPATVVVLACAVALSAGGMCGIGVGIAGALPRFTFDNPAHRVSPWAMVIGFGAGVTYTGCAWTTLAATWYLGISVPLHAALIHVVGVTLFGVMTPLAIATPLVVGSARLAEYEWEH